MNWPNSVKIARFQAGFEPAGRGSRLDQERGRRDEVEAVGPVADDREGELSVLGMGVAGDERVAEGGGGRFLLVGI